MGNYASINGLKMYYEIHGNGRPLVLLHGSMSTIDTDFGKVLPSFARNHQVIAVEQQAHGHTADIDRPLSYEQMAKDTAALLRQLQIEKADLFGYSLGGGIALQMAIANPNLVRKFVFMGGASFSREGLYPELLAGIDSMTPENMVGTQWEKAYARVAPQPENWPGLVAKAQQLDRELTGWAPEQIMAISAPAMLMIGDSDIVRPEHVAHMFRLLGGGVIGDLAGLPRSRLAVLPGTTHVTIVNRADWIVSMVTEFLDAPVPGDD